MEPKTKPRLHARDHLPGGADPLPIEGTDGPWIYVGTTGVDGVDGLLTGDSPPFTNGTNVLGAEAPVSFMKLGNGDVRVRGGFKDMSAGDVIFTLPTGYRPAYDQPLEGSLADGSGAFTYIIGANGDVTFVDFI